MGSPPRTMRALQYRTFGAWPEVVHVDRPEPGPGQVLLRITAAGVCHSDIGLISRAAADYPYGDLPQTLGHEGAGEVVQVGSGVKTVTLGDQVLIYGPRGCGTCSPCAAGAENLCPHAPVRAIRSPGLGAPGTMAEYHLVDDERHLVGLGDLDPVATVSLTDAGLTPYHALKASAGALRPGAVVVVIGVGGLGHVAVQLVRAMSACKVVAVDVAPDRLDHAVAMGAHRAVLPGDAADVVREASGGIGASIVLDLVGSADSTELAAALVARGGDVNVIGAGAGSVRVGYGTIATDASVRFPYWGSRPELLEVLDLSRDGLVTVDVETYSLDDAPLAYRRLRDGLVRGRAVVVP